MNLYKLLETLEREDILFESEEHLIETLGVGICSEAACVGREKGCYECPIRSVEPFKELLNDL